MATRQTDSLALARRCQEAGWGAQEHSDGWKVHTPEGDYSIHMTYSDRRSLTNVRAELERRGLKEAEAAAKIRKERERKERIEADRAAADERGKQIAKMAQHAKLRSKAAGPYMIEPEPCDLEWLMAEHPRPWMRWMYITADAAKMLLAERNSDNRPISDRDTDKYVGIILSGQWHLTHQGLAMDSRGLVQDAQHRLAAIARIGEMDPDIQVPFPVFVGMPPENFKAIDEGRARNAGQMLRKAGIGGGSYLVTVMRTVAAFDSENPWQFAKRSAMTSVMAFAAYEKDPAGLDEATAFGLRHWKKLRSTPGGLGAAYYVIRRANGDDNTYVDLFFQGVLLGRKPGTDRILDPDDPRLVLREKILNQPQGRGSAKARPLEIVAWFVRSWNNLANGHHPRYFKPAFGADIPKPVVCKPGDGAEPRAFAGEVAE